MNALTTELIYRKPEAICRFDPRWERITEIDNVERFLASSKKELEERASALGLKIRLAGMDDIDDISQLHLRCFPPGTNSLENVYSLFRLITFGYTLILEDGDGTIVGCNVCEGYDDKDRTSYGVRISVDKTWKGHNLGAVLVSYTSLLGMERGSKFRRGLLSPVNYGSASNFLNYVGYICEYFHPDLPGFGPRFTVCLPLTPGGLTNNSIDQSKLKMFLETHKPDRDYRVVACEDLEAITVMYEESDFRIAAFMKKGVFGPENQFFALPYEALGFPDQQSFDCSRINQKRTL